MRNDGALVFFFIFLLIAVFQSTKDKKDNPPVSEKVVVKERVEKSLVKTVIIQYKIEYGSVYTGDQSPIFHTGVQKVSTNQYGDIGANGLPISEWFPTGTKFPFKINERQALLRILSRSNNEVGLMEIQGQENRIFMSVVVKKESVDKFTVTAKPFVKT